MLMNKMKKILVIEPSGKLYGSEMVLWDIVKNKQSKNIDYTVALPPDSDLTRELDKIGIKSVEILNINNGLLLKFISYIKLFFYVIRTRPDLFFINQAGILRAISIIAWLTKKRIACQVSTLEDCPWLNQLNSFYTKPVRVFICNSRFIADSLKISPEKKSTLYYGYHWKELHPELRRDKNPFHIVLLGRLSESKGHFLLVKAVNELKKAGVTNIRVFFVGAAPSEEIEIEIKSKINDLGLEDLFVFRGFQKDIEKELSDKQLMIIPSMNEPFGRIFCEAAEAKIPAIVADSGGLGELSREFNLGVTFLANNEVDLASKIDFVMKNYNQVKNEFEGQSDIMLNKLEMTSYINIVEKLLENSIQDKNSALTWLGTNSSDK